MRINIALLAAMAVLLPALAPVAASAQSAAAGRLLVASPGVDDPFFSEAVVLLIEHGDQGSFGVLLNRPTWIAPTDAFPEATELATYDGTLFRGGPMLPATLLMVVRSTELAERGARSLLDDVFVTTELDLLGDLDGLRLDDRDLRLYAGHAAWEPGDLDQEVTRGVWQVLPARPELIFAADPADLWHTLSGVASGFIAGTSPLPGTGQLPAERTL